MAKATPTEIKVVKKVIELVESLAADEAESGMGNNAQYFAQVLIEDLKEKFDA